ncbi:uncharacterized protein PODANS_6_7520 [Podospora anserina S mat+]|uniref:Podospora anserina S mat+ genomic DNA chromosome 6, supercontig 2 n=1 Tax=Podospora anserina (strain S / ATCC MYA-4624 / DSM 980 / FGSC 10383) TaxID=515849 RepID=B2B3W9_PODAN|nr:uncharacterized protein PODANS_6_7520 [Podospora anserina S mat+]CAP71805.1 unnamed protein product [Podospora anserina S mat+]CDP31196.1 Putative protein of unknown function [Podospora anserina S mat+]
MAQPVRISQSFANVATNALPTYPNPHGNANATISGDSTRDTDPPYFAIASQNNWNNLGTNFLGNHPASTTPNHQLNVETVSLREDAVHHGSEGDVVRSAAMYLLHPINQALSTHPNIAITCQSEASTNRIRSDITYYRHPNTANPNFKAFAVVEFKKRGVITATEFAATIRSQTVPTQQVVDNTVAAAMALPHGKQTYFDGDSFVLIKQAASYAVAHRTPYVALFNWDFLVLVHFTQMTPTMDYVGDYCQLQVIPAAQSSAMRGALLGFLAHAYDNAPAV